MNDDPTMMHEKGLMFPLSDGEIRLKTTKRGHQIFIYSTKEKKHRGIANIARNTDSKDLADVLCFIMNNLRENTKALKLSLFYPKINEIVKRIYTGDTSWLEDHKNRNLVRSYPTPFQEAARSCKKNGMSFNPNVTGEELISHIINPS